MSHENKREERGGRDRRKRRFGLYVCKRRRSESRKTEV